MKNTQTDRRTKRIEWVTGGPYAVAVEVEAVYPVDDPTEPCYSPETVRYLEQLEELADRGDVDALRRAGKVYTRLPESA
jgi:hypothetical protein